MCKLWNKITGKHKPTASVNEGYLVLSLPGAISPIVWRIELLNIKSSTFEIHEKETDHYVLCLKNSEGKHENIAPFAHKEEALQALLCVSSALQNVAPKMSASSSPSKQSTPAAQQTFPTPPTAQSTQNENNTFKWVITIVGIAIVIGLFFYLSSITPKSSNAFSSNQTENTAPKDAGSSSGVPVSADDFLNGL